MTDRVFVDDAIGEIRAVRVRGDRPVGLVVGRWSDTARPRLADVYRGRVRAVDAGRRLAFVDLGEAPDGVLRWSAPRPPKGLVEGVLLRVEIAAEAYAEKGPRLRRLAGSSDSNAAPGRESGPFNPGTLFGIEPTDDRAAARGWADLAVDLALATRIALAGDGAITIEPTRALTAIDIDSAAGGTSGGLAPPAAKINAAAALEIARQCALRSLGGLLAVDFIAQRAAGPDPAASLAEAFAAQGVSADVAPVSRFGIVECALVRGRRPIAEDLSDAAGRPTVETTALAALRGLEAEAAADRGARLTLAVAPEVARWFAEDRVAWRAALTDRIGARFDVVADAIDREFWDVRRS